MQRSHIPSTLPSPIIYQKSGTYVSVLYLDGMADTQTLPKSLNLPIIAMMSDININAHANIHKVQYWGSKDKEAGHL